MSETLEKLVKTQIAINNYTGPSNNLGISYARKSGITGLTNERGKPLANVIMTKVIDTNVVKKILRENGWNVDVPITSRYRRSEGLKGRRKRGRPKKLTGNSYYAAKGKINE